MNAREFTGRILKFIKRTSAGRENEEARACLLRLMTSGVASNREEAVIEPALDTAIDIAFEFNEQCCANKCHQFIYCSVIDCSIIFCYVVYVSHLFNVHSLLLTFDVLFLIIIK